MDAGKPDAINLPGLGMVSITPVDMFAIKICAFEDGFGIGFTPYIGLHDQLMINIMKHIPSLSYIYIISLDDMVPNINYGISIMDYPIIMFTIWYHINIPFILIY